MDRSLRESVFMQCLIFMELQGRFGIGIGNCHEPAGLSLSCRLEPTFSIEYKPVHWTWCCKCNKCHDFFLVFVTSPPAPDRTSTCNSGRLHELMYKSGLTRPIRSWDSSLIGPASITRRACAKNIAGCQSWLGAGGTELFFAWNTWPQLGRREVTHIGGSQ